MRAVIISATILAPSSYWQFLPGALATENQKIWYTAVATQPVKDPYIPPPLPPKPVPKPPPSAPPPRVSGDRYDKTAQCESGMNQKAVSKDGKFLSFFQWLISTWHSVGGAGDPRDHSYAEQKEKAQKLSNPEKQWPVCWAKTG